MYPEEVITDFEEIMDLFITGFANSAVIGLIVFMIIWGVFALWHFFKRVSK